MEKLKLPLKSGESVGEVLRGGVLFFFRILVAYPLVFGTYRLRGWTKAPYWVTPKLTDNPGILVANHSNYVYDTMLAALIGPVCPFVFIRDEVCRFPVIGWFFRFFRAIPYIRASDRKYGDTQRREGNLKALARGAKELSQGSWLAVFPEGSSSERSRLGAVRPGVAHVALLAEAESNWNLGLKIYVYGLNYENRRIVRSSAFVQWAEPILVSAFKETFAVDPIKAERDLTAAVQRALSSCVLQAESMEQLEDAHRLASQNGHHAFAGVQMALANMSHGVAQPKELRRIVCSRQESLLYQVLGFGLFGVGWLLGLPFRIFGKLCATERSQEMGYKLVLWVLVLLVGSWFAGPRWAAFQLIATYATEGLSLWAWRRGIL